MDNLLEFETALKYLSPSSAISAGGKCAEDFIQKLERQKISKRISDKTYIKRIDEMISDAELKMNKNYYRGLNKALHNAYIQGIISTLENELEKWNK